MSRWKQGDTHPDMVIYCYDSANTPAHLSDATEVRVLVLRSGVVLWQRVIVGSGDDGVVTVPLQPSDTAAVGTFLVKVKATWADGTFQHYPPAAEYMKMTVTR